MKNTIRAVGAVAVSALVASVLVGAPPAAADDVNVAPVRQIKGPANTQLSSPLGMYVRGGNIHISNFSGDSVSVFATNANGDVPPMRHLAGAATLIDSPRHVAADNAGFTWVANASAAVANRVLAFGPTADGNVAPDSKFNPGFAPFGIAIDMNSKVNVTNNANTIAVFPLSATGTPAAERTITSTRLTNARGLAVDSANRLWVANGGGQSVVAFNPGASGDPTPYRVIKGASTKIQYATDVAVDSAGRIYVSDEMAHNVKVFAASANGDVAPIKVLGGPATALSLPAGLAIGGGNSVVVSDYSGNDISTFAPLFKATPPKPAAKAPGKPRALKVKGKKGAKKRTIVWKAPATNGGAAITAYRLVIKKGSKTLVAKTFGPGKRSFKVKRAKLRNGKNVVFVKAKNSKGFSKNAKKTFRVRK